MRQIISEEILPTLVPEQESIRFPLPVVLNNVDHDRRRALLERIDELLRTTGVERKFMVHYLAVRMNAAEKVLSTQQCARIQGHARRTLRCNILKALSDTSYRDLSRRLADSSLLQWFIGINDRNIIRVPSKSTLERFYNDMSEPAIRELVTQLISAGISVNEDGHSVIGLEEPLCLDVVLLDSTCIKLDIHYPVDWVLLRDGIKSLIQSITHIRSRGLVHRMPRPESFLKKMNMLSMEMTHTRNKSDSKKGRKRILRVMKKLTHVVIDHGKRYKQILIHDGQKDSADRAFTENECVQILARLDNVLNQLPAAIEQAHERIIGERQIANTEKILSLYENHACVYNRGKSGARIEFGLQLLLAENMDGMIVDWDLVDGHPKDDTKHLQPCLLRIQKNHGASRPQVVVGDRGFTSAVNTEWLIDHHIEDMTCPLNIAELSERLSETSYARYHKRRAQTEARIGIVKSKFLGSHIPAKGYARQANHTAWCMLAHNLWVLARLPLRDDAEETQLIA